MTVTLEITPETEQRLKQLAEVKRQPLEATLNAALDALEAAAPVMQTNPRPTPEQKRAAIERAVERISKLPVLDPRTPDEILGYDENGLPS